MTAIIDTINYYFQWGLARPADEAPRNPACKLALRRICGTCTHYEGELRPSRIGHTPEAALFDRCGFFGVGVGCRQDAARCKRWERKTAPAGGDT